jgi:hypothetical protein
MVQGGANALLAVLGVGWTKQTPEKVRLPRWPRTLFAKPQADDWAAAGVCLAVATGLSQWLMRTESPGQVMFGLFVAFLVGGALASLIFSGHRPLLSLLSPLALGLISYLYTAIRFGDAQAMLGAWFDRGAPFLAQFPGTSMALPSHFASIGLVGVAGGLGLGHYLHHHLSNHPNASTAAASPAVSTTGSNAKKPSG